MSLPSLERLSLHTDAPSGRGQKRLPSPEPAKPLTVVQGPITDPMQEDYYLMNLLDQETYVDVCSLGQFTNEREDRKELVSLNNDYVEDILKDDYQKSDLFLWVLVTEDTAEKHYEEQTVTGFCVLQKVLTKEDAVYEFPVDAEFYDLKLVCSTAGGGLEAVRKTIKYAKAKAVADIPSFYVVEPLNLFTIKKYEAAMRETLPDAGVYFLPLEAIEGYENDATPGVVRIRRHMQEMMVLPLNAKGKEYLDTTYPPAVYEMNKNRLYDILEARRERYADEIESLEEQMAKQRERDEEIRRLDAEQAAKYQKLLASEPKEIDALTQDVLASLALFKTVVQAYPKRIFSKSDAETVLVTRGLAKNALEDIKQNYELYESQEAFKAAKEFMHKALWPNGLPETDTRAIERDVFVRTVYLRAVPFDLFALLPLQDPSLAIDKDTQRQAWFQMVITYSPTFYPLANEEYDAPFVKILSSMVTVVDRTKIAPYFELVIEELRRRYDAPGSNPKITVEQFGSTTKRLIQELSQLLTKDR